MGGLQVYAATEQRNTASEPGSVGCPASSLKPSCCPGSGVTAGIAARITGQNLQHIRLSDEAQSEIFEANEAVTTKKELARQAQQAANKAKAYRPDLQLRAEVGSSFNTHLCLGVDSLAPKPPKILNHTLLRVLVLKVDH